MANYYSMYDYDSRAYGIGNLSPLLGMGSTLAGYMGHNNLAKMLGQANGLMGNVSKYFPNGFGSSPTTGGFGGSGFVGSGFGGNGFGGGGFGSSGPVFPWNPGSPAGFGGQGFPFGSGQLPGPGMPYGYQGGGFGGFGQSFPGSHGPGFGSMLHSLFGSPGTPSGFGGGMPGFF